MNTTANQLGNTTVTTSASPKTDALVQAAINDAQSGKDFLGTCAVLVIALFVVVLYLNNRYLKENARNSEITTNVTTDEDFYLFGANLPGAINPDVGGPLEANHKVVD